jgi:DNA adenine methylase
MLKLRPAKKTHGGKSYLARRIIRLLPAHRVYVEPFAGGLSVLLNKTPAHVEIANDLDAALIGLYRVLQDQLKELLGRLNSIPYDAAIFKHAKQFRAGPDAVENALWFLVRNRFSRGGLGQSFAKSDRLRGGRPGDLNAWLTIQRDLPRIARRLVRVTLRCQHGLDVICEFDGPDTLAYVDPPYLEETRTARRAYGAFEMSREDHERLLDFILAYRGMVVLSGYANPLYDRMLAGWERVEFELPNNSGQGRTKQRRTEVLWLNPNCVRHSPAANQREFAW